MKVKISVVVPCYNCSQTIEECIDSAINQTYSSYEILLIDDGSLDNTLEKLYSIQKRYINNPIIIKIYIQENQGPSMARNKGIQEATGDWIAFLDSDDIWYPFKNEMQMELLRENPKAALLGGEKGLLPKEYKDENLGITLVTFLKNCFKNYFLTSSTMVNSSIGKDYNFNVLQKHSEDYRFFLEILADNHFGIHIGKPLSKSIDNKRDYGESGLSGNIYKMEKGELSNFVHLYKKGKLSLIQCVIISIFSTLKFFRRVLIVGYYTMIGR